MIVSSLASVLEDFGFGAVGGGSFLGGGGSFLGGESSFLGGESSFLGGESSFLGGGSSFLGGEAEIRLERQHRILNSMH